MYYLVINNEQKGPFPKEDLLKNGATADTLVWQEGMADWKPMKDVAELQTFIPAAPPPPPPPVVPSPPSAGPSIASETPPPAPTTPGSNLEDKQMAEEASILDSEFSQAAKDTFTNMDLSTDDVLDFKSNNFSANRATVYAISAAALILISIFFNTEMSFGVGGLFIGLLFSALPTALTGLTFLEMSKLLAANGGQVGSSRFRNGGIAYLAFGGVLLLVALASATSNPLAYTTGAGLLAILGMLAFVAGLVGLVFVIMAAVKVMNYEVKFFKELGYAIIGGLIGAFVLSLIGGAFITSNITDFSTGSFEIVRTPAYIFIQFLTILCRVAPLAVMILIFQRAGKNGGKVT
ncbi:MAG: GYF domain-containing protein [Bacteroidota bacterium]